MRHLSSPIAPFYVLTFAFVLYVEVTERWRSPLPLTGLAVPSGAALRVELAETPAARSRGLSNRDEIRADGLLLRWSEAGRHPIWMVDMKFPLDVVWIGAEGQVLAVEESAPPCAENPCPLFDPPAATTAIAVLELPAGHARRGGLVVGAVVSGVRP